MRKKTIPLLLTLVLLALSTTAWLIVNREVAYAEPSSTINASVDHVVTVLDGGQVTIKDTVQLSANQSGQPTLVSSFNVGFPYEYKFNLDCVSAYKSSNSENKLVLDLDFGLGNTGFYAVRVNFGNDVDLNSVASYNVTVVFVFSDLITEQTQQGQSLFYFDFPALPSLAQEASMCKTTVILPLNANFTKSNPYGFNQTTSGVFTLVEEPLDAFTLAPNTVTFKALGTFSLLKINEVKRDIVLDEWKELLVSDFYNVTNKAVEDLSTLKVPLPKNASGVSAQDELGNTLTVNLEAKDDTTMASVTLKTTIRQNDTAVTQVAFGLPWTNHVDQNGWDNFSLKFKLFESMNLTLRRLTVTLNLPEGAEFQSSNPVAQPNIVQSGAFQETPIFTLNNVTSNQNLDLTITYTYSVFWAAFRPTLWTGAAVLIVGAIAFLWRFQRAPTPIPTALLIRPEEFQNYVKTYDETRKLLQERESLEAQARKGKIPRRLYKVRSRTLESRLSVLSRDLANLREKIRAAGPRYAELMRQIEVAESELQGAEVDIRRTEVRYRRGEISAAAYHKLLEDTYRRRDRAKTNIDGVLLRLREEIS